MVDLIRVIFILNNLKINQYIIKGYITYNKCLSSLRIHGKIGDLK
jgi:hypothetical protein